MQQVIAFIFSLDSSFVIRGSTTHSKKISVVVTRNHSFYCITAFIDSLSSDNTAC